MKFSQVMAMSTLIAYVVRIATDARAVECVIVLLLSVIAFSLIPKSDESNAT